LGNLGLVTRLVFALTGFRITDGFNLGTKLGLEIVYLYFQFPLMVLIIAPALAGLRKDWREAAENLGASPLQYWRYVALPVLMPSILGAIVLLFGNAFGAQATAYQLTGGLLNIVTLVITAQIRGDVLHNPGLGYAVAMGMVVIIGISILFYSMLQRRSERWLRG
jgi:putative spermidine/putrescine transport system permease protein